MPADDARKGGKLEGGTAQVKNIIRERIMKRRGQKVLRGPSWDLKEGKDLGKGLLSAVPLLA